ncbi:MAG TPA: methyltransferase domain-containing protein [Thermoanaerobaculia bacterium]|nr:methyltransferase domain-containing protein [Thermoanaerobaculia bacterium]
MKEDPLSDRILHAHLREMPFHRVLMRSIEARILAEVRFPRPVLDVGCGDGHFASVLFPDGTDVGLDPGIADAREAARRGVYRMVVGADSGSMPFPDGAFASVFSNCVFEHIPDIERTIAEISRVLRPGGVFACTLIADSFRRLLTEERAWARLGLRRLHAAYVEWFNRKAIHYHFDPPARWTERFEAAGLRVNRWRYYVSPEATRVFHRAHYVSLPHLVARKLTGKWVPFPTLVDNSFWFGRYRRFVDEPPPAEGSCIAYVCEKAS